MEEYNNKRNKSLLDTETINNTTMSEGEGLGLVDSTKEFAKDIFINAPLAVKDFFSREKQKTEAETNVNELMQQTRERLKLTDNPFIETEESIRTIETANKNLEQIRNSPFANIITLKEDNDNNDNNNNKELEYLKASQYNSSNNILKNGTKGIVTYRDKDNNQKQLTLTGNEFITEDMDNIYIKNNNDEEQIIIPKQFTKEETLKDNYTNHELELIRNNDINYRHMTDEEWNKEINEVRTNYYSLNKALTKRMQALAHNIPDNIREDIDYQDTIGINELTYLEGIKKKQEPLVESTLLKIKQGKNITKEEEEALWYRKYINYSIQKRGVAFRAEAFTGIKENTKNNLMAIASVAISDYAVDKALLALGTVTGGLSTTVLVGSKLLKIAAKFNQARKSYKTLNYGTKALKFVGVTATKAGVDTLVRTHLMDRVGTYIGDTLFANPNLLTTDKESRLREKRNNRQLEYSDKGGLYIQSITQQMEDFLNYQDNVEQYNEALSERAVDPIIDSINPMVSTLLDFLHVPTTVRNSAMVKVLKKINDIPAIAGTPLHSIGTEHLEELFGLTMNHLMKANDPDTTLSQAIAEYLEPRNFALSTVNIYVAGGLIRGVSNAFTQNPNGKETISINRTALKNYFSNIFNHNPNMVVNNSLDVNNYNEVIDNLPETKIDNLAQSIFDKEDKLSKERYDNKLLEIKDKLLKVNNNNETEANNLIKIYDAFFSQNALNYGVNRYDVANKMSIDFNLLEDNTGLNGNNTDNNNIIKANINNSNGTNAKNINIDNNNQNNNAKNINNNNLTLEDYITNYSIDNNKNQQSTNIANYNPYVLDQNNNITIDTNTLKNTKTVFSNYSKKSKNSFTPMEWGYIQNSLKNNIFEGYYFDKNNRKLIIDLENVLITLSGENFNYLETAQKLPNYKAFEKWQEEHKDIVDSYNNQKKAKTIKEIIAEAKELIGYRVSSYNQAINKNLNLTQEVNVLNIKNSKNSSKAEAKKLIWEIAETGEQIDTLSEPWVMDIINDRAKKYHLLNSSRYGKFSREDYFRRNVELNNIKDIINNSVLVERVDNNKLDKKPNVEEYFYFYTPITDGKNIYLTKLFAEKLKGENDLKNIHLYDIMDIKTLDANLTNQNISKDKSLLKGLSQASSLSIEQILKNVKDSNGNNAHDAYITENTNSLNQEETTTPTPETTTTDNNNTNNTPFKEDNNPKGRINFLNGAKAIVELFRNKADQSTLLHETAHYFLKVTQTFAEEGNIIAEQQIEEVKNWTASELTKDPATMLHERFARGFELYVRSGKSNNSYLKEVFDYFRGFLERIYKSSEDLGIDVNNNQMYEFFDKYLYNPDRYSNWVYGDDDDKDNNTKDKQENVTNDTKDIGINAIENNDNLTSLILNQSTETNEDLQKAINERIKDIIAELEAPTHNVTTYDDDNIKSDRLTTTKQLMRFTRSELNLLRKALNEITTEQKNKTDIEKQQLLKRYDDLRQRKYNIEKELKYQDYAYGYGSIEDLDDSNSNNLTEEQKAYVRDIYNTTDKLWDKTLKEEEEFRNKILDKINNSRLELLEEAARQGYDGELLEKLKDYYKPFENIKELLANYEERISNKEDIAEEQKDYYLSTKDYEELINFKQKTLNKAIGDLIKTLDQQSRALRKAELNRDRYRDYWDYAQDTINRLRNTVENNNKFNEEFKNTIGITPENLKLIMENASALGDSTTLNKLLNAINNNNKEAHNEVTKELLNNINYDELIKTVNNNNNSETNNNAEPIENTNNNDIIAKNIDNIKSSINQLLNKNNLSIEQETLNKIINTAKRHNSNPSFILKEINRNKAVELKKNIQNTINGLLQHTVHFSKTTGKLYGDVLYKDSNLIKKLKEYNKLSMRKAGEELIELTKQRKEGNNKDNEVEYQLKRDLLFFRSTPAVDILPQQQMEILNSLGKFIEDSRDKQNEVKRERLERIIADKQEALALINNSKVGRGKSNLGADMVAHLGNLPTLLEYVGGKKLADKFDFIPTETAYRVNTKAKTDNLFNGIFEAIGGNTNIEELLNEYSKPLMELEVFRTDDEGNDSYRQVRLRGTLEALRDKLLVELEAKNDDTTDIRFLKSLETRAKKGGGINTYNYNLSEYEFGRLEEIINKTKYANSNILGDNQQKYYNTIVPYSIDTWGLMYYYLQSKNKETAELINRYYGEKQVKALNGLLQQQTKDFYAMADTIYKSVQDRDELNVYYVLEFNKDMGQIENYFPRVSFHQDETSIFDMLTLNNNRNNQLKVSAVESRSKNSIPNLNNNPILLALKHIRQTEFTKTIAVELNNFNNVFNSPTIKQAIIDNKGQDIYNSLNGFIDELKYGYKAQDDNIEKTMSYFVGNWAKSVTNTPSVFLKQITSTLSYMEDIDRADFMDNYINGLRHPKETLNYMLEKSPYIKTRFDNNQYQDIIDILANNKLADTNPTLAKAKDINANITDSLRKLLPNETLKKLSNHTLTEIGDILSVIYGGYARIQTQLKNNKMTEKNAILDFERQTVETQQSDYSSLKPKAKLRTGLFNRLSGMFRSQDAQYLQKSIRDIIRYINKEDSSNKILKRTMLYHVTLPFAMTLVQGLINNIYGKKDKKWWEYTTQFMTSVVYSFLPLSLLGQSVAVDLTFNFKNYKNFIFNTLGTITGLPSQAYYNIFFNRYYDSKFDLYDSEETKKKKKKREKEKEKK